jgi:hypothetical protein
MSYYHYTKGCHLPSIVKDGVIKTSKVLLDLKEKPAVWLTKSPEWEVACNVGKVLNTDEFVSGEVYLVNTINSVTVNNDYMKKRIGMCRIIINELVPVVSWAKFKYVGKISDWMYDSIDSYSKSIGCTVNQWICTFAPIPQKYWEGIEVFVDNEWVKWDERIPIKEFVELCISCNNN